MKLYFMQMRFCLLILGLMLSLSCLDASSPSPHRFGLDEALEYASEHGYTVGRTAYDVESAQRKVWETIAGGLPQVELTGLYQYSIDMAKSLLPIDFFPKENWPAGAVSGDMLPVSFGMPYDAHYGVGVTQMIFDGSYIVGVQAAKVFLELAAQQRSQAQIDIRSRVAQSYFLVLSAQENLEAFASLLEANEQLLAETEKRYANGLVEKREVDQLRLIVNTTLQQLNELRRNELVARSVLNYTMGLPHDSEVELTDRMVDLTGMVLSGGVPSASFSPERHIAYQHAESQVLSQQLLLRNERVQYLPTIEGFYNYQKMSFSNSANVFDADWFRSQVVGVRLRMPIFSSGARLSRVRQGQLAYEQSVYDRDAKREELMMEFLTAHAQLMSSYERYFVGEQNRDLGLDILEQTRIRFQYGVASGFEYSQQQTQYIETQLNYVETAVELLNAHVAYLKAGGLL